MKKRTMQLKKMIVMLGIAALTAGSLTGCGGDKEEPATAASVERSDRKKENTEKKTEDTKKADSSASVSVALQDPREYMDEDAYTFFRAVCDYAYCVFENADFAENTDFSTMAAIVKEDGSEMSPEEMEAYYREGVELLKTAGGMESFFSDGYGHGLHHVSYGGQLDFEKARAAAQVLSPHTDNLIRMGELAAKEHHTLYSPEMYADMEQSGLDFDALYASYTAEAEASAQIPDTAEKVFSTLQVKENVLFDRDGVRFTFDGFEVENGYAKPLFTLENGNQDNKKVYIDMQAIYVNRLFFGGDYLSLESPDASVNLFRDGLEAGETVKVTDSVGIDLRDYDWNILEKLGVTPLSFPLEQIGFVFEIRIGSQAEEELCVVNLETSLYDGESYRKYFGERLTTLSGDNGFGGSYDLEIFGKMNEEGITVFAIAADNGPDRIRMDKGGMTIGINGQAVNDADGWLPDEYYRGFAASVHCPSTEEELRRSMEIGSSESFALQLVFGSVSDEPVTLLEK